MRFVGKSVVRMDIFSQSSATAMIQDREHGRNLRSTIIIISIIIYLPNNTTVYTFAWVRFRRAGQQGPIRTLTAALKRRCVNLSRRQHLRDALFDALHQLSGTHYRKLFSVVKLLQFSSLG